MCYSFVFDENARPQDQIQLFKAKICYTLHHFKIIFLFWANSYTFTWMDNQLIVLKSVPKTFTCSMNNTKPSSFVPLLRITYNSTCNTQFILCWWLPLQKVTERYFTIKTDCNPNQTSRSVVCLTSTLSVKFNILIFNKISE